MVVAYKPAVKVTKASNTDLKVLYQQTFFEYVFKTCQQIVLSTTLGVSNFYTVPSGYALLVTYAYYTANDSDPNNNLGCIYIRDTGLILAGSFTGCNIVPEITSYSNSNTFPIPIIVYAGQIIDTQAIADFNDMGFVGFLVPLTYFSV